MVQAVLLVLIVSGIWACWRYRWLQQARSILFPSGPKHVTQGPAQRSIRHEAINQPRESIIPELDVPTDGLPVDPLTEQDIDKGLGYMDWDGRLDAYLLDREANPLPQSTRRKEAS